GLRGEQTFNTTTNVVTFTANPVVTNIIQGVTVTDAALVNQVGGASNITASMKMATTTGAGPFNLVAQTNYQILSTTGTHTAADNVLVIGNTAETAATNNVNSILVVGNNINISGAATNQSLASGMIVNTGGTNSITVGTLTLTAEGKLVTDLGSTLNVG